MSFLITVATPVQGGFKESVQTLKDAGMFFVPERKCWIGEICADAYESSDFTIRGAFVWDSGHVAENYGESALNSAISGDARAYMLRLIDSCADFKGGGR